MNISEPLGTIGITGLRVLLCLNVLFLAIAIFWFGIIVAEKMYGLYDRNIMLMLLLLLVFVSFGISRGGQEIFYWYTGACVYTMPMSLTFCCLAFYVQCLWEQKTYKRMVILCIMAFLASGGVLQVTAILCYGMLIIWGIYLYRNKNKNGVLAGLPFMAAVIGALINAFAPGNFVRHTYIEEGIHIFKAIKNVLKVVISQMRELFTQNLFLYVVLFCLVLGIYAASKSEIKAREYHPVLLFIILLIGMIISVFPFCLGAGTNAMPMRNIYVCDLYVGWGSALCALELGSWLGVKNGYKVSREKIFLIVICAGLVFFRTGDVWKIFQDGAAGRTFYELCTGNLQRCSLEWSSLLQVIENTKESEVEIQARKIPETILMKPGLSPDKNNWVNVSIAEYYGKDTLSVIFTEEK